MQEKEKLVIFHLDVCLLQWLCALVAVLLHYLYTASFTWMSAEGLHLYFEIVTVFNLESIKMVYYVIFCWGE